MSSPQQQQSSCFTTTYYPSPTRAWNRYAFPFDPLIVTLNRKQTVLQHRNNRFQTKKQALAQILKGKMLHRKTYASQTETNTNYNTNSNQIVNSKNLQLQSNVLTPTTEPVTTSSCPLPPFVNNLLSSIPESPSSTSTSSPNSALPESPPPDSDSPPPNVPTTDEPAGANIDIVIFADGGQIVATVLKNYCTGEIFEVCVPNNALCFPTYFSDVPGPPVLLCSSAYFLLNSGNTKTTYK